MEVGYFDGTRAMPKVVLVLEGLRGNRENGLFFDEALLFAPGCVGGIRSRGSRSRLLGGERVNSACLRTHEDEDFFCGFVEKLGLPVLLLSSAV